MTVRVNQTMAAAAIGLCCAILSNAANAESNTVARQAELHQACMQHDGQFEQSWIYNDQGVKWGKVVSCTTKTGKIKCQGDVCRSDSVTASNNLAESFPAEPAAFSNMLTALSGK